MDKENLRKAIEKAFYLAWILILARIVLLAAFLYLVYKTSMKAVFAAPAKRKYVGSNPTEVS